MTPAAAPRDEHLRQALPGPPDDEQVVGGSGRFDRALGTLDDHLVPIDGDHGVPNRDQRFRVRPGQRPGRGCRAGQQFLEYGGMRIGTVGVQQRGHDICGQQWARRGMASELMGHQRQIGEPGPTDGSTTALLIDQQAGPAQFGTLAPVVLRISDGIVTETTEFGHRHLRRQEPVRGVPEELLIVGQLQQHGRARPHLGRTCEYIDLSERERNSHPEFN